MIVVYSSVAKNDLTVGLVIIFPFEFTITAIVMYYTKEVKKKIKIYELSKLTLHVFGLYKNRYQSNTN